MPFWKASDGRILLSAAGKGLLCDECPCDPPPPLPPGEIITGCLDSFPGRYCNDSFPNPVYLDLGTGWGIRLANYSLSDCADCTGTLATELNGWLNGRRVEMTSDFCETGYSKEFVYEFPHPRYLAGYENPYTADRIGITFRSYSANPLRTGYPNAGWYATLFFSNTNRPLTAGWGTSFSLVYGIENCDWEPWPKTLNLMVAQCSYGIYTYTEVVCKNSSTYPDSIEAIFVEP